MSRLGKKVVVVPAGIEVKIADACILVKGPKGELSQKYSADIAVEFDKEKREIEVKPLSASRQTKANHGLYRSLINNMIVGVNTGYSRNMLLEGVGYRVALLGTNRLVFNVGFCHQIEYFVNPVVKIAVESNTKFSLQCHDKQMLGQVASEIRSIRPPEPYKGKGIRYADEVVRRKEGKAAGKK